MSRPYKKVDKTAPRFRPSSATLLTSEFYNRFYKKHPEYRKYSKAVLKTVIKTFNGFLQQGVIDNRDGVELPESLGYVFLGSCKPPIKENLNHQKSGELGVPVVNRNLNSDSYLAKLFYTNYEQKYRFKNRDLWKFKGCRKFTNSVSEAYVEKWPNYIVVENYVKISSLYRESKIHEKRMRKRTTPVPDDYNEFHLD